MRKEGKRIVVIERERCKPEKCGDYACMNSCPVQRAGKKVFEIIEKGKPPKVNEELCIGCGICVRACNFGAIHVVHLPAPRMVDIVFRYGPNAFALYRLPIPMERTCVGLLGQNATGKTTSLKLLAGILRPNFGKLKKIEWDEIIARFKGSPLQSYFKKLAEGRLKVIYKPQYVDVIPKKVSGIVSDILKKYDERGLYHEVVDKLKMQKFLDANIKHLSGGELQKLACAVAYLRDADVYMFDEPSSYLDVAERLRIANLIRDLAKQGKYVLIAEHDLAILDYVADTIHIYYGEAGAYGIVSPPYSAREGINVFLEGYERTENVRFREYAIRFSAIGTEVEKEEIEELALVKYPTMKKRLGKFELEVEPGELHLRRVYGVVGPNAIGKTTFVRLLAGILKPDEGKYETAGLQISYKPQYLGEFIGADEWMLVIDKLKEANPLAIRDRWYQTYLIKPLGIDRLYDYKLGELSGGNLQKVAICYTLMKRAHLYLLDEPTAYVDAEERWRLARILRTFADKSGSCLLVVDHDMMFIDYVSDYLIVFEGEPEIHGHASKPLSKREGMNQFLKNLGITFRRDKDTLRPRINKPGSRLDLIQKQKGEYYYIGV